MKRHRSNVLRRSLPAFLRCRSSAAVCCFALVSAAAVGAPSALCQWRSAEPGFAFAFPRDHYAHPDFKTEWWYFTGRLESDAGDAFGFQITFFRQGIRPPGLREPASSRFVVDHFHFAHAAVSDLGQGEFASAQKIVRGAFGEAGHRSADDPLSASPGRICWIEDWWLDLDGTHRFSTRATLEDGTVLELALEARKPPVINGIDGISRKAEGDGNASHYYSLTRMHAEGRIIRDGRAIPVAGQAWCDREWGTSQLGDGQAGWDWFSLRFSDGTELMIYQLRRRDGSADRHSSGTFVHADGTKTHLESSDFSLVPSRTWTSSASGASYPVAWTIAIPDLRIELDVEAVIPNQELTHPPVIYWEGAVEAEGRRNGLVVEAEGFLELTGYAGQVPGLGG